MPPTKTSSKPKKASKAPTKKTPPARRSSARASTSKSAPKKTVDKAANQQAYSARQRAAGKMRKAVWIPRDKSDEFDKAVARLKKKWDKEAAA